VSLLPVMQRLQESSGRYDLLTSDWLFHANRASRSLDSKVLTKQSSARAVVQLGVGESRVVVDNLRALQDVWLHTSTGKVQCDLSLRNLGEFRSIQDSYMTQTQVMQMLNLTLPSLVVYGKIYCVEIVERSTLPLVDKIILARVNLTNTSWAIEVESQPIVPTELIILIEDGLLYPQNPARDLAAGTTTIVGVDKDGNAITEVVSCVDGEGEYRTSLQFKTVTTITAASFNNLIAGDEKITVKSARLNFLQDLDIDDTSFGRKTLLFYPTMTEKASVEIFGLFWSKTLTAVSDSNFWTEQEPDVLSYEISRRLEIPLRNREGFADWSLPIQMEIDRINADFVEAQESHAKNTMWG